MADASVLVSIILVNYNGAAVVLDCLRSIREQLHAIPYEVIVVDNASTDGSPDLIAREIPTVHLIRQSTNRGFGAGNNAGAAHAAGEFLFLLNTDTQLIGDCLPPLIELMKTRPNVGIVGPKLLNADGSLQLSIASAISISGEYQTLMQLQRYQKPGGQATIDHIYNQTHTVDIVVGAAMLIRKTLFNELGGFDETFFMYLEESDLCQRARDRGWKILYTPDVSLIHLGGYSVGKVSERMRLEYRRSQLYYYQKHRPIWEQVTLRIYLLAKFTIVTLKSFRQTNRRIIALLFDFRHYPLRSPKSQSITPP